MAAEASLKKARGAFFTPPRISEYLVEWAIQSDRDRVLEPSCGEASFLVPAGKRLKKLGASDESVSGQLHGVEIDGPSADYARHILCSEGLTARITQADFFAHEPDGSFDVIVGNPPFIRYQQFSGESRAKSLEVALQQGVRLSGLASSWAAFVVKAASHLSPTGRMALVLPAELLSVGYAAEVRNFLLRRFGKIRLIAFEERIFPDALEEVVLLLAEGSGGANCFELFQSQNASTLSAVDIAEWTAHEPGIDEKWTGAFVAQDAFQTYQSIVEDAFENLAEWGGAFLGSVTGNNKFFCLSQAEFDEWHLQDSDVIGILPPGAKHLKGLSLTKQAWRASLSQGSRGLLFSPTERSPGGTRYIDHGENAGVHNAYKCRVRNPWWKVPQVKVPDLFLTYMNHDRPRLISNEARVAITNSVYGISLKPDRMKVGKRQLPLSSMNSVTLLGAEIVGRSYGGGLLKMEPREADLLPLPSKKLLEERDAELKELSPQVTPFLRRGDVRGVVEMVDRVLYPNLPRESLTMLRVARETLFERRKMRGRNVDA